MITILEVLILKINYMLNHTGDKHYCNYIETMLIHTGDIIMYFSEVFRSVSQENNLISFVLTSI